MGSTKLIFWLALLLLSWPSSATSLRWQQIQIAEHQSQRTDSQGTARIVGGSNTDPNDYPFMAALVFVNQNINTTATVNARSYPSTDFSFSPTGSADGILVDCGLAGQTCTDAQDKICLIERGDFNFSTKALNCEAGGGVGAIIYNNVEGPISNGTLGNDFTGTIPVVAVSRQDGQTIQQLSNPTASILVSAEDGATQDLTCGGSFLGDKWVLTAAHCVDSVFSNQLRVNVSEYDLSDGADNAVAIKRIYSHPNYVDNQFDNDVALLELTQTLTAPAIQLANEATTLQFTAANRIAKSIGWGGRIAYAPNEGPTGNYPDILQEVELPLLTNSQCRQVFANSQNISVDATGVTDNMICAALDSGGRSACQGDSGGPLFVESNQGLLQVGITSWGIGCAAQGYPGVYARVGTLRNFIDATRFGVGISGASSLTNSPVNVPLIETYTVTNNSQLTVSPSFSLSGSNDFTLDDSDCTTLPSEQSCQLAIIVNPQAAGKTNAAVTIQTDLAEIPTTGIDIQGFAVAQASALATAAGVSNSLQLFSGGDNGWRSEGSELVSGDIGGRQSSILIAQIEGPGTLRFDWSVSSEENIDEPTEPFDALYLIVNGEQQEFISGEVAFNSKTLELGTGSHLIEWTYRKDPRVSELNDQGRLRNISYTSSGQPAPPAPQPPATDSSGGGAFWLLALVTLAIGRKLRASFGHTPK